MPSQLRLMLLIPLASLIGCTLPTTSPSNPTSTGEWTNWQIQGGPPNPTPPLGLTSPPTGTYLVGALQIVNSDVTGVFTTNVVTGTSPSVVDMTGTFDSSTGAFSLDTTPTAYLSAQLTVPSDPTTLATGTLDVSCPPPPPGGASCNWSLQLPAAGAEIAPLNATYTGTLTDTSNPSFTGTGTLTLTQSTTPNASGAFPLTATLTFPASSGFGSYPVGGAISGEGIALSYSPPAVIGPGISLTASTNPTATQITVSNLTYLGGGIDISATFTGTLTLE